MRLLLNALVAAGLAGGFALPAMAQARKARGETAGFSAVERSLELAETGHCRKAVPRLLRLLPRASDPALARRIGFDGLACSRALNEDQSTVAFLLFLNQRFPRDPDVLYVTTHAYSDLSLEASEKLLAIAPTSVQAMMLDAESLEVQQKWAEAKKEYLRVLRMHPDAMGIHLRIARDDLSEPPSPQAIADAKKELQEELRLNPDNAAAEDLLGSIALKAAQWNGAIAHFSRAAKLDAGLTDAFFGLGMALNSAGRFAEAVAPLRVVEQRMPGNPSVHYQLLMAYSRLGKKEDAAREIALFRETSAKAAQEAKQQVQGKQQGQPQE